MRVCVCSVFILFCVYIAALRRAESLSTDSCRLYIGLRNRKAAKGQRALQPEKERDIFCVFVFGTLACRMLHMQAGSETLHLIEGFPGSGDCYEV
jgi:hypothetical protein